MPGSQCSVGGCSNKRGGGGNVSLHKFPADPILKKKWVRAIKNSGGKVSRGQKKGRHSSSRNSRLVCSEHFKLEDFAFTTRLRRLNPNAVPSLFGEQITVYRSKETEIIKQYDATGGEELEKTKTEVSVELTVKASVKHVSKNLRSALDSVSVIPLCSQPDFAIKGESIDNGEDFVQQMDLVDYILEPEELDNPASPNSMCTGKTPPHDTGSTATRLPDPLQELLGFQGAKNYDGEDVGKALADILAKKGDLVDQVIQDGIEEVLIDRAIQEENTPTDVGSADPQPDQTGDLVDQVIQDGIEEVLIDRAIQEENTPTDVGSADPQPDQTEDLVSASVQEDSVFTDTTPTDVGSVSSLDPLPVPTSFHEHIGWYSGEFFGLRNQVQMLQSSDMSPLTLWNRQVLQPREGIYGSALVINCQRGYRFNSPVLSSKRDLQDITDKLSESSLGSQQEDSDCSPKKKMKRMINRGTSKISTGKRTSTVKNVAGPRDIEKETSP